MRNQVPIPPSPHGLLPDGRVNFRGFPLNVAAAVVIESADFTGARSPKNEYGADLLIMLAGVKCTDVIFDRARVFHSIDGTFDHCSFKKIGTAGCGLTGTFRDCDFSGTSFRKAHLIGNFIRCRFHDCNLRLASWGSSFSECEFAGSTIDDIFADIREIAMSAPVVTFAVVSGKVKPGETRHY